MSAISRASPDTRRTMAPFDVIGDVHGCASELEDLLGKLGYGVRFESRNGERQTITTAPGSRRAIFVGDLVDRGPRAPDVLRIVMSMVEAGHGLCVPGNHDMKFLRWLNGKQVKISHGLDKTVAQMNGESAAFRERVKNFLEGLPFHLWLDGGRLAVAHAGIQEKMIGHCSGEIQSFCLYGETSGETDQFGLPIRYHWAAEYGGGTAVVYGHTPVPEAEWFNNTLCLDTGCCFGGNLTAMRWPEREIESTAAKAIYTNPVRPFGHPPVRPAITP